MEVPSNSGTLQSLSAVLPPLPGSHPPTYRVNDSVSTFYSMFTPLLAELAAAAPHRLIVPVIINVRHFCSQHIVSINGVIYILCDDGDLVEFAAALRAILTRVVAALDARRIALAPSVLQLTFTAQLRDGKAKASLKQTPLSGSKCPVDKMLAQLLSKLVPKTAKRPALLTHQLRLDMAHMGWSRKAQVTGERPDGSKILGAPDLVKQVGSSNAALCASARFARLPMPRVHAPCI